MSGEGLKKSITRHTARVHTLLDFTHIQHGVYICIYDETYSIGNFSKDRFFKE